MNFNLTPRFYYTLNIISYLFPKRTTNTLDAFFGKESKILAFNSARVGLRLLLSSISNKHLKIGVQAFTCHTVFQAIDKAGHKPVFIDLTDDFKLDLNDLENKIKEIDVVIVTHTFGFPDHIDAIKKVVGDKIIIEDCSHSFLSKYRHNYTGIFGDASIFSMGIGKFPPIGTCGLCVVNKPNKFVLLQDEYSKIPKAKLLTSLKEFIKVLIYSFMMKPPLYGAITYSLGKKLDAQIDLGNKFSFLESKGILWGQRILNTNLSLFEKILIKQTENAKLLCSLIKMENSFCSNDYSGTPNYYVFPLLLNNRDKLYHQLLKNNVEAGKHFHKSIEWATEFGYKKGDCPNTEKIVNQILTVPIHSIVTKNNIKTIANIINENK